MTLTVIINKKRIPEKRRSLVALTPTRLEKAGDSLPDSSPTGIINNLLWSGGASRRFVTRITTF